MPNRSPDQLWAALTVARRSRVCQIHHYKGRGFVAGQTAQMLGVKKSTIYEVFGDPYRLKSWRRRHDVCPSCGKNKAKDSEICTLCARENQKIDRTARAEFVIGEVQRFAAIYGRRPTAGEWLHQYRNPLKGGPYPNYSSIVGPHNFHAFRTWADLMVAAGFPRPKPGAYVKRPRPSRSSTLPSLQQLVDLHDSPAIRSHVDAVFDKAHSKR